MKSSHVRLTESDPAMNDSPQDHNTTKVDGQNKEEMVTVVDRKERRKEMTRSEYESNKRRKRKREKSSAISFRSVFSMIFIIALMFIAALIALKIVQ